MFNQNFWLKERSLKFFLKVLSR